jgi:hypothetical protein
MWFKSLLIVSLLAVFLAAPIVDAIACDDCRDIIPLRNKQQLLTNENGQSTGSFASPCLRQYGRCHGQYVRKLSVHNQ